MKLSNRTLYKKEFEILITEEISSANKSRLLVFLADINRISGNHIESINILNGVLNSSTHKLSATDSVTVYDYLKSSYYKMHLYPEIFEINSRIEKLIANGAKYPLWSYNSNSRLYAELGQYDKAVAALKIEINNLYKVKDRDSLIIPSAYNDLGYYFYGEKKYDSAQAYFSKSIQEANQSLKGYDDEGYKRIVGVVKGNIATIYMEQQQYELAIPLLIEDIKIGLATEENMLSTINTYNVLVKCYLEMGKYDEANAVFSEMNPRFPKGINERSLISYLKNKTEYFHKTKQYDSLNYYFNKTFKVQDSIEYANKDKLFASEELVFRFTEEQRLNREHKIEIKNQEIIVKNKQKNNMLFFAIIVSFLLLISVYNSYKLRKSRKEIGSKNKQIKSALLEKEVLLKEVHHRVKNNLQIISGLLELQNIGIEDTRIKTLLQEGQNRIQSVALVHKMMYQSDTVSKVNMQDYLTELVNFLKVSFEGEKRHINTVVDASTIDFDISIAVPISLIVNEVVCNAYKHAFNNREEGNIKITLSKIESEMYQLIVKDDGIGLPDDFNINRLKSIGFDLIKGLSKQIKGKVVVNSEKGTEIIVTFVNNII